MNTKLSIFFYCIYVNGQEYQLYVKKYCTLFYLMNFLHSSSTTNLNIIEYNGEVTNFLNISSNYSYLQNKDQIEIITLVGGG